MKKFDFKNVSSDTWIRTAVLLFALINQALNMFGVVDKIIPMEEWTKWVSYALTAISAVWAWWKNNSFTPKAQKADKYLHGKDDINV